MVGKTGYSTKKRAWILQYFSENPDKDVCVNDIYEFLVENDIEINVTTIYRYLDKLVEQGIVLKTIHGRKEQATYQYMNGKEECCHHLHMKCQKCGSILHLDCSFMSEIIEHIGKGHGFAINCKESYLAGICKKCRQ